MKYKFSFYGRKIGGIGIYHSSYPKGKTLYIPDDPHEEDLKNGQRIPVI